MHAFEEPRLRAFAAGHLGLVADGVKVRVRALGGGLQSAVALVSPHVSAPAASIRPAGSFVVKHVLGACSREASVYSALHEQKLDLLPRLLGTERVGPGESYLYLEFVRRAALWPWPNLDWASRVLQALADLHAREVTRLPHWDYESFLQHSAEMTLEVVAGAAWARCTWVRPGLRHLRRVVAALPEMRRVLLAHECVPIHGDVHPGNIHLALLGGRPRIVILDWARARSGSGLEDIASWLHSLGYCEPSARQRHDTLLKRYLLARGAEPCLTPGLRLHYWLAAASNALAGALRYHMWLADPGTGCSVRTRARAQRATLDWLRVIRCASEYWKRLSGSAR